MTGNDDGGIQEHNNNNNKNNKIKILEVQNVFSFPFCFQGIAEVFNISFAVCPSFCMIGIFPRSSRGWRK